MTILAALGGLLGIFAVSVGLMGPIDQILKSGAIDQNAFKQLPPGFSPEKFLRTAYTAVGSVIVVGSATLYVLGLFVRRGRYGAIVTSIVLTVLILLWLAANAISALASIASNPAVGVGAIFLVGIPTYLAVRQVKWLILAARTARQIRVWREQAPRQAYGAGPAYVAAPGQAYAPPVQWPSPSPTPAGPPAAPAPGGYHAAWWQPPVPPPGYVPAISPPAGSRPVVYGYAQAPDAPAPVPAQHVATAQAPGTLDQTSSRTDPGSAPETTTAPSADA